MVHYVTNGDLKNGTTLCGLKVRASMGVIATRPEQLRYVGCPECRRVLLERSNGGKNPPHEGHDPSASDS